MQDPLQLSELLCARLCHDLSGPLGSLIGTAELAAEEFEGSEALAVAAESAAMLGRRIRFLRAAWAGDTAMDTSQVRELAAGVGAGRRVEVDLSGLDPASVFAPGETRVMLNLLLLAVEGVAGNGRLAMAGAAGGDVLVTIDGPRAAWPAGLANCLADEKAAWQALTSAQSLQAPLTALIARRAGLRLSLLLPTAVPPGSPPPLLLQAAPTH